MIHLHQIDPVALALGPLKIHWYGLMYLLGFLVAWYLGRSRIRAGRLPGVDENGFGDLMFFGMLGVVLGGRLGYVLFYKPGHYLANPLEIFAVWQGGMSFHGGLLGATAFVLSQRYSLLEAETSTGAVLSTGASIVTVSLVMALLAAG